MGINPLRTVTENDAVPLHVPPETAPSPEHATRDVTETTCCIVGGGPAGVVLAYLLARRGIAVTLLMRVLPRLPGLRRVLPRLIGFGIRRVRVVCL